MANKGKKSAGSPAQHAGGLGAGAGAAAPARPIATSTYRLHADQAHALQQLALDRRFAGVAGKPDHSSVLRDLLDAVATGADLSAFKAALSKTRPK